ncbi:cupin [Sphingobium sufflavum]|uniref:1,2-dihydroxy-3-keto-5-methylthiopentene dioxygenase n=1 Tax=Sphingobium sufflavum TaxID=1129547 RepID=UPI001F34000B|nr:cupin domain-containing protein [Sphingobium sufflavum]MCE7796348.1 cupin [Sphingobium sufflavum]
MTALALYDDRPPHAPHGTIIDRDAIAVALAPAGVRLEQWDACAILPSDADDAAILSAYGADVARLKAAGGYQSCDVVRLTPHHPQRVEMRAKFLAEHVHDDDEVRFFVEGSGLFYIRANGAVMALECTAGDLIVLPAGTHHWFDTGAEPHFTAIRLFTTPDGWVARFTGDEIAKAIPLYDGAL